MKKKLKKILLALATLALFTAVVFVAARWGWKLFGFMTCRMFVGIEEVTVDRESVYIKGVDVNSLPSYFVGYIYDIDGTDMYVGVKYNAFLGVLPDETGDFEITIPVKDAEIRTVYLKNNSNTRKIWDIENGKARQ